MFAFACSAAWMSLCLNAVNWTNSHFVILESLSTFPLTSCDDHSVYNKFAFVMLWDSVQFSSHHFRLCGPMSMNIMINDRVPRWSTGGVNVFFLLLIWSHIHFVSDVLFKHFTTWTCNRVTQQINLQHFHHAFVVLGGFHGSYSWNNSLVILLLPRLYSDIINTYIHTESPKTNFTLSRCRGATSQQRTTQLYANVPHTRLSIQKLSSVLVFRRIQNFLNDKSKFTEKCFTHLPESHIYISNI